MPLQAGGGLTGNVTRSFETLLVLSAGEKENSSSLFHRSILQRQSSPSSASFFRNEIIPNPGSCLKESCRPGLWWSGRHPGNPHLGGLRGSGVGFADVREGSRLSSDHRPSSLATHLRLPPFSMFLPDAILPHGRALTLTAHLWGRKGDHTEEGRVARGRLWALNAKFGAPGVGGG